MPRVLSRAEYQERRLHRKTGQIYPATPPVADADPAGASAHAWFGRPADAAGRTRVLEAAIELAAEWTHGRGERYAVVGARRGLTRMLDWLDSFPGETYQDRWLAADPDSRPRQWCPEIVAGSNRRVEARHSISALIMLGVIRPSYDWMFDNRQSRFWRDWTITHDKDGWDRYFAVADREQHSERRKWWGAEHLIRICVVGGLQLSEVRGADVLAYRRYLQATNRMGSDLLSMWHYARLSGLLPGEPDDLGALTKATQLTPAELVDRYRVVSPKIRNLLVDYVSEMATTQDYGSLETASANLIRLFWKQIEHANPGIDTIRLTPAQASAWKTWLRTKPDGQPRRYADNILGGVRSFYLDIAAWAHEDPARWAEWAVPCPVSIRDVRGSHKRRAVLTHRMQARTRTLAPHLPTLAAQAKQRHHDAVRLRDLVQQTPVGQPFTFNGQTYLREPTTQKAASTSYVTQPGQAKRIDTDYQVVTTFMTWSMVEVLRHTGVRIEELLEITHLSIRQYRKPDGSILPLLQIAPSKTDEERILPCSPELTAALARLVNFVSIDNQVPLCVRRDVHERTYSSALPHLFQVREAGRSRTISTGTVRNWLLELADDIGLRDVDGSQISFTPHDFRRLFITDVVNSGFPIHLAAKLVGHKTIETTRGYTATYQTDIFEAYEQFIATRRQLRPSEEYREPTQQEWDEFVEHFGQRKIALGSCHRPYGASCVHEHACIRCDFLQVDPGQAARLADIRTNLEAQIDEAQRNQWLGDVDQLRLTIAHADRKAAQLRQRLAAEPSVLVIAQTAPETS